MVVYIYSSYPREELAKKKNSEIAGWDVYLHVLSQNDFRRSLLYA